MVCPASHGDRETKVFGTTPQPANEQCRAANNNVRLRFTTRETNRLSLSFDHDLRGIEFAGTQTRKPMKCTHSILATGGCAVLVSRTNHENCSLRLYSVGCVASCCDAVSALMARHLGGSPSRFGSVLVKYYSPPRSIAKRAAVSRRDHSVSSGIRKNQVFSLSLT